MKTLSLIALGLLALIPAPLLAWDYSGHRTVNLIAVQSLPAEFPAFVKAPAARERIAFLAGEPDRWRNTQDNTFKHFNEPDHFMDLDYLAGFNMKPESLSPFRYEFISQLAVVREKKPDVEPVVEKEKDLSRNRALFGLLPWTINEHYSKLKSAFSYLKTFEKNGGTPDEIRNAQENILYIMGTMGHFVGDATQPLHTTKHYNGWIGENPKGYPTKKTFHSWIDGGYLGKAGLDTDALVKQAKPASVIERANSNNEGVFKPVVAFIAEQHKLVEMTYQFEKDGKFSGNGTVGMEGKAFLHRQILAGGQMLGNIWLTAWQTAPEDSYLKSQLARRALGESGK